MGFGHKWIKWIKFCISTANFFVLNNGAPTRFFGAQRGLQQGHPLSPFPFLLLMERLNNMLKTANTNGLLKVFDVVNDGRESLKVSQL